MRGLVPAILAALLLQVPAVYGVRVELEAPDRLSIRHRGELQESEIDGMRLIELPPGLHAAAYPVAGNPHGGLRRLRAEELGGNLQLAECVCEPLRLSRNYRLESEDGETWPVIPAGIYDGFRTELPLGATREEEGWVFRLFAPRAESVRLHLYRSGDGPALRQAEAAPGPDPGVWVVREPAARAGMAYTWSVEGPLGVAGWTGHHAEFCDPWAEAVASRNEYRHPARALLLEEEYNWSSAGWQVPDPAEWVIYEAHLRDMTAHASSGARLPGSYPGFWDPRARGGLNHLLDLGVNAVEFLPLHDFGNIEIDYRNPELSILNTWNSYERNHWGYMTSYFFAPESYYASGGSMRRGIWSGVDGRQVGEMKELVDRCHLAGVAVILDVVYNHVSQYDDNCFKALDPCYWFRLDDAGSYTSGSGCGNDFHTARPMARRLILESLRHWVEEYHVDGFRFDLGAMLDDETLRRIHELLSPGGLFPDRAVFHTAEPWGGGEYEPRLFAELGWAWWNDVYRVDLRGRNPGEGLGFLFGRMHPESSLERLSAGVRGGVTRAGGFNDDALQSVNYASSHDDHCLGDWIRLGLGICGEDRLVEDPREFQVLGPRELRIHGLAAIHLLTSAGVPMLHQGQELGRSKIIAAGNPHEERRGMIDHNSYEKDNTTNYLDFRLLECNGELAEFYGALIRFRRNHPELARGERRDLAAPEEDFLAWILAGGGVAAALNSSPDRGRELVLPGDLELRFASGEHRLYDARGELLNEGSSFFAGSVGSGQATRLRLELGPRSAAVLARVAGSETGEGAR